MHHPFEHLVLWCRDELKQIIEKKFILSLNGHNHEQNIYYNKLTNKSLVCSAPQLFTSKNDSLGYAIICIEDYTVNKIIYRQYVKGKFLNGQKFSENNDGIVELYSDYKKDISILESKLENALSFFKGQSGVYVESKISKERDFNVDENLLDSIIIKPSSSIIVAQPQFGLTCLAHYMRLEAYKKNSFWIYIDAKHTKSRNLDKEINIQLQSFNKTTEDIRCIVIDSWNSNLIDHRNILTCLDEEFKNVPLIVLSNYTDTYFNTSSFDFKKLGHKLNILHLQAFERNKVREFVSKYNEINNTNQETLIVKKVVRDLDALNIHRTPLNCLTLLKVLEKNHNHDLVNRTKMTKALLFILFTDSDTFRYSSDKPDVDDCEYILGRFCSNIIGSETRRFDKLYLKNLLQEYCEEKLINVDIDIILNILESNNILIEFNDKYEFKHSYWIYYFASNYMLHDVAFNKFILSDKKYVNYPEIIEFYTGLDGRRNDAIEVLLHDLNELINTVEEKIGIKGNFLPFEGVVWSPNEDTIEKIKKDISDKVQKSNLPDVIKDQHADQFYNSESPYDQSINKFFNEYSVISLMQGIKASSRALRNSKYVAPGLKKDFLKSIIDGWEQISKVIFWIAPTLAQEGRAAYEGLGLVLMGDLKEEFPTRLKNIIFANPFNVVNYLKDNLTSKKIGPLIFNNLKNNKSELQMHLLALFLIYERPLGWHKELFEFINLLHKNSFILNDIYKALDFQINKDFVDNSELAKLKNLMAIIVAKHKYFKKSSKSKIQKIPPYMTINKLNKLPVDQILAAQEYKYIEK